MTIISAPLAKCDTQTMGRRSYIAILAIIVVVAIILIVNHWHVAQPHKAATIPEMRLESAEDVFAWFHITRNNRDYAAYGKVLVAISDRRLLEGKSSEQIKGLLGEPSSTRTAFRDPERANSNNPVKDFFVPKVQYWIYELRKGDPEESVGIGLAFSGESLLWSFYEYGCNGEILDKRLVRYIEGQ